MPPKDYHRYDCFADLATRKGERTRFHWSENSFNVLVIHVAPDGEIVDTKTLPKLEARRLWAWLLNAGWEPYGIPLIGRGYQPAPVLR